jgi:hypothetical protein
MVIEYVKAMVSRECLQLLSEERVEMKDEACMQRYERTLPGTELQVKPLSNPSINGPFGR